MARLIPAILVVLVFVAVAPLSRAEEPAAEPASRIVSDEEAKAALDTFKEEFRARGLKGDDKMSQRDWAMSELAQLQHPDIVEALAKVTKSSNHTLRILAVIYIGEQTELPGLAGPHVVKAMKRAAKDPVLVLSALQSLGRLRYLGAHKEIGALLDHHDVSIKKAAVLAIGQIGEMRLLHPILELAGVHVQSKPGSESDTKVEATTQKEEGGEPEVVEEGYSYEGAEATVDYGDADNTIREIPEAKAKVEAQIAENKRKAMAKRRGASTGSGTATGGGSGSGVSGGTATGRQGAIRDPQELLPFALRTLRLLTGKQFQSSKDLAQWVRDNHQVIRDRVRSLNALEKAQKEEAKALK